MKLMTLEEAKLKFVDREEYLNTIAIPKAIEDFNTSLAEALAKGQQFLRIEIAPLEVETKNHLIKELTDLGFRVQQYPHHLRVSGWL